MAPTRVAEVAAVAAIASLVLMVRHRRAIPVHYPWLQEAPLTRASGFSAPLSRIAEMIEPRELRQLVALIEEFLETADKATRDASLGFTANRLADSIRARYTAIFRALSGHRDGDVAMRVMQLQQDDLPVVEGLLDDHLRNMLLLTSSV